MRSDVLLALLVGAPLGLAAALGAMGRNRGAWAGSLLLAAETVVLLWLRSTEGTIVFSLPWIEAWGIFLAFRLDGLAWVFAIVVTSIGALVLAFVPAHMPHHMETHGDRRPLRSLHQLLLFFVASMLGVVLADDLLTLYVCWELISVASFLLIGFHLQDPESRRAALHSLVLTAGTGIFFFASLMVLFVEGGNASLHDLLLRPVGWLGELPAAPIVAFGILLTAAAKSVLLPFYGWLPAAMIAPTPVSALLHSATLVASGVYLLARFHPLLGPLPGVDFLLLGFGTTTALIGGVVALLRTRLKEVLAWSTISYYGQAIVLIGLGARSAAVFFFAFHAFAKAGLFLVAGAITHTTGAEDIRALGGLWRTHPALALLTLVLALGLAGFPPTAGFWMKELLFHAAYGSGNLGWIAAAFGAAILSVAYFARLLYCVFLSPPRAAYERPRGAPLALVLVPAALATIFAAGGHPTVARFVGNPLPLDPLDLAVPSPWRPYTYAALVCLPVGLTLFLWFLQRRPFPGGLDDPQTPNQVLRRLARRVGFSRLFEGTMILLGWLGGWAARLQTGKLAHYATFLIAVPIVAGLVFLPSAMPVLPTPPPEPEEAPLLAVVTITLALAALALAATLVQSHVSAIVAVGGVGYLIAILFALLRAPDIAFVQMVVETATALLLLAALSRIPPALRERVLRPEARRSRAARAGTAIASALLGTSLGVALFASMRVVSNPTLGKAFYPLTEETGAASVVKTILADFRAMDTLGEISVFATAVLGVVLLIGRLREVPPRGTARRSETRSKES